MSVSTLVDDRSDPTHCSWLVRFSLFPGTATEGINDRWQQPSRQDPRRVLRRFYVRRIPSGTWLHVRDLAASVSHSDSPNEGHAGRYHPFRRTNCELHVSRRNNSADLPHVRPSSRQCHTVSAVVYHNTSRTLSQSCATLTVHTDDVEHVH